MERRDFLKLVGATSAGLALARPRTARAFPYPPRTIEPSNPGARRALGAGEHRRVLVVGGGLAGLSAALELAGEAMRSSSARRTRYWEDGWRRGPCGQPRAPFGSSTGCTCGSTITTCSATSALAWGSTTSSSTTRRVRLRLPHLRAGGLGELPQNLSSEPAQYHSPVAQPELSRRGEATRSDAGRHVLQPRPNFRELDDETFADWADRVGISKEFYEVILEPAASVTLNDPQKISAAEMIMYTHLYFISQPRAMDRDITTVDHGTAVIDPWRSALEELGARFELGRPVPGLRFARGRAVGEVGSRERFDAVVLACDVPGAQAVLRGSEPEDSASAEPLRLLQEKVSPLAVAPPYKVMRVWFDRQLRPDRPDLIETPQHPPINLLAQFHLLEDESRAWAEASGGSVIEFHLYANDKWRAVADEDVWPAIRPVALEVLPELTDARVLDSTVGSYENFTSFEVGQATIRPDTGFPLSVGCPNLTLAGDWLHTDYPSALMERAVATGREAANHVLLADSVEQVPITVTTKHGPGLL